MTYRLLHAHGTAGPHGKRSYYIRVKRKFKTTKSAEKTKSKIKKCRVCGHGYKVVPQSKLGKTKERGLYYIKNSWG
jgi:hypothetical protein